MPFWFTQSNLFRTEYKTRPELRSPDFKFSAPSGFQQEDLNYKVWDYLGLLVRMRSLHSNRTTVISRTSGQTGTPKPKDTVACVQ